MSGPTLVITGAGGGSPNRLEINDFVANDKFFSLYIQALQMMYNKDFEQDVASFFQVGGIHGLPYVTWNGATGNTPSDDSQQWEGYCFHGSVLFPTWHRPYVMLYEQILQQCAEQIAATYTVDQAAWQTAATQLRQPYWDWAKKSVPPPQVITLQQVTITASNGKKVSVANPLYHYTFNPNGALDALGASPPFDAWPVTHRHPRSEDPNTTDNTSELTSALRNQQSSITANTYNMLTRIHDWPGFSNHTVSPGTANNSLESIHDNIHVQVGWGGHMTDPSVAGFDPIFYLHHTNVDRMLSLWAALNPTVWVTEGDSVGGSFTQPADTPVDGSTGLTPFWNTDTTFWASNVQATSKLGYTYPEFNGLDMGNPDAVATAIGTIVNNLYGSHALSRFPQTFSAFALPPAAPPAAVSATAVPPAAAPAAVIPPPAAQQKPLATEAQHPKAAHGPPPAHPKPVGHEVWDWTARIEFKKYELKTSFSVLIFIGLVPENPNEWLTSPNFVGSHSAFVNSAAKKCANCVSQADLVEEGFVHLDQAIAKHSELGSLDPKVVGPYLKENLHWRVLKTDGSVATLQSLEVAVLATLLTLPAGTLFPNPEKVIRHNHITYGRSGGSREA